MSSSQLLIPETKKKTDHVFFVYYNESTGALRDIANKKIDSIAPPYLMTSDPIVRELILGNKTPSDYVVTSDSGEMVLVNKIDAVRIKNEQSKLYIVPTVPKEQEVNVGIIIYKEDYLVEVNINDEVAESTGFNFMKTAVADSKKTGNEMEMVVNVIKDNNPFLLLESIKIKYSTLLDNRYALFKLLSLKDAVTDFDSISVIVNRVFDTYGVKFIDKYAVPEALRKSKLKRTHTPIMDENSEATISFVNTNDGWVLRSNFLNPTDYKIYKDLTLFVVGKSPFDLIHTLKIPKSSLGWEQDFNLGKGLDLVGRHILADKNCKFLTFNVVEETK